MTFHEASSEQTQGSGHQWTAPKAEKKINLTELAQDAVIESNGDTAESAALFLKRLKREHKDVYLLRAEDAMRNWAQDMIRHARTSLRGRLASAPSGAMTHSNQALDVESLNSASLAWFDWPVLPGVMLRDATKADLDKASLLYLSHATVYTKRGNWLHSIAEALPDDVTPVSAVLSEGAVASLASTHGVASS